MKKIYLALLLLIQGGSMWAQKSSELGFGLGFSTYLGDLKSEDFSYRMPGFAHGFSYRQNWNPYLTTKAFLNVCRIHGDDRNDTDPSHRSRNLNFRSDIWEIGYQAEYNVLPFDAFNPHRNADRRHFNFTPYFFGGLNLFHFNPKTYYKGSYVALQPLNTEGQNSTLSTESSYSRTQFALPFGFGLKAQLTRFVVISYEVGFRKTFTDYLDDVSGRYVNLQSLADSKGSLAAELSYRGDELPDNTYTPRQGEIRGNPDNKDWYIINSLNVAFKLYKK
ncbi:MAG: outer membrane beta-barrel protein [Chitinophagaceae bacterium]|nr:outer membrane beta-barrel protein [Chitinophagaceae bacterium]